MKPNVILLAGLLVASGLVLAAQQSDPVIGLMKEFTEAFGPSGSEGPVRKLYEREMRKAGAEISTDGLGSVIAKSPGGSAGPRVMVDAHLDEVGLMVRAITKRGFIKVQQLGGWLGTNMVGQRWTIMTAKGPVPAVSGTQDAHIATPELTQWSIDPMNVFLDVGARNREDAEAMGIRLGDPIAPASTFLELANHRYAAKAWDDRIGLLMQIEALKQLQREGVKTPNTVFFTGTVQEEVGLRGALTTAQIVKPDVGIAIEVGIAADSPGTNSSQAEEELGAGPGIFAYDNSTIPNRKLFDLFRSVAEANQIPLQTDLVVHYGEDAASMQKIGGGVPVINFVVPARYTHANTGIIDRSDFDKAVRLLAAVLKRLDAATVKDLTNFE
ncbi:MAG TPA: M42 family metallopeptidase [Terriglobia bacterium]|nr:M42 family metallopeptidase [Terriglobia bacterium]